MALLEAMHYPSPTLLKLADHTYVRCCAGAKAWGCWGGKTGGSMLRSSSGSTNRADKIAGTNERAGITCYLVNGVCHQAANRILLPAGITVAGAKGYSVSVSLFGPYGRPRGALGLCKAPFRQHTGVSGDLSECVCDPLPRRSPGGASIAHDATAEHPSASIKDNPAYLRNARALYERLEQPLLRSRNSHSPELEQFMTALFGLQIQSRLGKGAAKLAMAPLTDARRSVERARMEIEHRFAAELMTAKEFADAFDVETLLFQDRVAEILDADDYQSLLGLGPEERVVLSDRRMMRDAYPDR